MTEPNDQPTAPHELPVDDLADFAIVTDEGPEALDVEDEDPGPLRDTGPRPEDGPQDVSQDPCEVPA